MSVREIPTTLDTKSAIVIAVAALVATVSIGGAAVGIGPAAGVQAPAVFQQQPETTVGLEPTSATVDEGATTTYDVVVESADGGVGAYDFTVSIGDSSVASITDVSLHGSPSEQTSTVSIAEDGTSADVTAALANTSDSGSVTIATVTVSGDTAGSSDVGLTVNALGTEAGVSYAVASTTNASITVEADQEPADFQVSNLNAPASATQGETIDVSADVTNDGGQEATQTVQFRLDLDGDGTLDADEMLTSQEVTLESGATQTVTFSDLDTSSLDPGEYVHGVVTEDDSASATITIEAADDDSEPAPAPETAVSMEPTSATVDEGATTTYDVVVESADGGVGAYDFTVSVGDSSVASITDVSLHGSPSEQTSTVSISQDNSSADVTAALANTSDSGNVTIATVTVSGDAAGSSDVGLTVNALGTEAGVSYVVAEVTGASITVDEDDDDGPEPDPADFQVSNLNAPASATQGDAIDVSADVTNDGGQEATQTVQFRLDLDGDGTLDADEQLTSQEVTLESGATQTVTFSDLDTSGLDTGEYTHGVVTADDAGSATITIVAADDDPEPAPAPETAVRLQANSAAISQSETATFDVVVESADGGVGAYDFTVSLDESSAASITDVSLQGNPSAETTDVSIAEDGSSADVTAALADTDDTGSVTIATVTVTPEDFGTIEMGLTVDALGTEAGEPYVVTETTGSSVEVIDVDPEPAEFVVSNLNAPASATQGEAIDVSADITNEKDEDGATKTVQFRLDLDGDGTLDADETLASQELTLNDSQTKTVTFSDLDTSSLDPGEYVHGVVTEDDSASATITIEAADEDEPVDRAEYTRDEIAQAKYGYDFAELSTETAGQVQEIYNRQPFPDGTQPDDISTREELASDRYGHDFDDLSRETTIEVQNDYDAQFGALPSDPAYSRDEIAQAKYGYDFADLSTETAGQVQEIYNRQPFPDGTQPDDISTREELASDRYGHDFDDLSRETTIEVQNDYDAQFDDNGSE